MEAQIPTSGSLNIHYSRPLPHSATFSRSAAGGVWSFARWPARPGRDRDVGQGELELITSFVRNHGDGVGGHHHVGRASHIYTSRTARLAQNYPPRRIARWPQQRTPTPRRSEGGSRSPAPRPIRKTHQLLHRHRHPTRRSTRHATRHPARRRH